MADAVIEFPSGQIRQRLTRSAEKRLSSAFGQLRDGWRRDGGLDPSRRDDALDHLTRALVKYQAALVEAVSQDFGHRSPHETKLADIHASLSAIRHARRHFRRWMRPSRVDVALPFLPGRAQVEMVPLGVVGIISPWNYPIQLALIPLATAIAAGNRVLLKPSEMTPRTTALLERLLAEVFEQTEVAVVAGGVDMAQAVSHLPLDHLLFTGSTAAGRQVMRAASDGLVPVTLELGGKSPAIIGPGFDLETAAERVAIGKLFNAGQTCVAPDYALVPQGWEVAFADHVERAMIRLYPRLGDNPDYTSIISDQHYERLLALIDDARRQGAQARFINPASEALEPAKRKLAPTLLWNVPATAAVMAQEIFGPILPILSYRSLEEAVVTVNSRPRPLALYLFSRQKTDVDFVLNRTRAGGITVNDTLLHAAQDALPFGGIGESGMGAYHGEAGFRTFSQARPLFYASQFSASRLVRPPYGDRIDRLLRWLIGR
ncbi:coniferyl aldehyde dehydrogenase [Niveispirillum lacus]|uniref:Aldehyde dehydrogenase n=1 Tax=Niveispirillum lacus TaxID=1981099 RepID=A0A255Z320_9PROT|nr:coniferyl aldehyde dehydrogenase [Niveispirillum lacus]OYQ35831.1 coniferyl aldehyde dehydrogenase [Niveispirillum lacus]